MSSTVDNRIVEMQFNNKQFESGIQTSLRSLGNLEKGLQLKGAANGLSELDRATKSISFGSLANGIDFIASKFSALGIMGVTAMQNIANSVYHTVERTVKSLTVDPIMAGFSEYETQINSIQTILANTQKDGTTLTDVTAALDELNTYADKTIYNFTEMTRNIGTFTAAGVKLDTATNAIQGIANLAAISGSTSQQASTAMYQLSQAMASGTVKLMDWNSVVNAGMGGQVFQDALKETAKAHNINIDSMIEKHGSFRETLSEGWITTEVLTETLEKFTATTEGLTAEQINANREMWKARGYTDEQIDAIFEMGKTATDAATKVKTFTQLFDTLKEAAQSGWTQSWEILIGDFEEAKSLLTSISNTVGDIINQSANSRNTLLQGWKDAGGRDDLLAGFKNIFEALKSVVVPVKEAFQEMFPPATVDQLVNFTKGFREMTERLVKWTDAILPAKNGTLGFAKTLLETTEHNTKLQNTINNIVRVFKGFFAIIDIGVQGVQALASGFGKLLNRAAPMAGNLLEMAASLGDFLVELSDTVRETGFFQTAMDGITSAVGFVVDAFKKLTDKGAEVFKFFEDIDLGGIEIKIEPLKSLADAWTWVLGKLQGAYEKALPFLTQFGGYVSDAFGKFTEAVGGAVQDGTVTEIAKGGLFTALIVLVTKIADTIGNIGDAFEGIGDIFEGVTGALEGMQNKLNAEALKSLATAIAILAGSLAVIALIPQEKLTGSLGSVTAMFVELMSALAVVMEVTKGSKMAQAVVAIKAMKSLATAVLILAAAMAIIGNLDANSMAQSLIAIISLMGMMVLVIKKLDGAMMTKGAGGLIAFAVAVGILALSVKLLGTMDLASIGKGLLALVGVISAIAIALKVYDISGMSISSGIGLIAMAVAIGILGAAVWAMGSMDIGTIAKGLLVMAAGLTALCIAAEVLPDGMIAKGVGLMAMAAALVIMGAAIAIMGSMSFETLVTGLIAMGVALTELVVAANLMKGSIGGAAAILIMAGAMVVLGAALHILGALSIGELITGLIAMAGSLAIMGVAAALLAPLAPAMLILAAGVAALGLAIAVNNAALLLFGVALAAVGTGIAALAVGIVTAVTTIVSAIPVLAEQIGAAIIAIAEAISTAAPACGEAISVVIQTIIDVLVGGIASISESVGGVGPAILKLAGILLFLGASAVVLAPLVPAIIALSAGLVAFGVSCAAIAAGVTLLAGALALLGASGLVVADSLSDIYNTIDAMGDLSLDAVLSSAKLFRSAGEKAAEMIIEGLDSKLVASSESMGGLIAAMVGEAEGATAEFSGVGETLALSFSQSMTSALQNGVGIATSNVASAMRKMVDSSSKTLAGGYSRFLATGATMITKLASGMTSKQSYSISVVGGLVSSIIAACGSHNSGFYQAGADMVQGLVNGINGKRYLAVEAGRALGLATKNATKQAVDAHSPSRDYEDIGMWMDMGLANGLIKFAKLATNAAKYVGESTIQPVMTMTDNMLSDLGSMGSALRGTASLASALDSSITCEQYVTVTHTFEDLTVKGVNDRNEFVAVANYSVEEMMTELMRKGIRR